MKVLILIDKLNWAYHSIAKALVKYNHLTDLKLNILPIKANISTIKKQYKKYDKILVMGWQTYELVDFLPRNITFVGLHSFHSWDERKTTPERDADPPKKLINFLSTFRGINAVSLRLTNLFNKYGLNVQYTPNGVDSKIFLKTKNPPISKNLVVGYSGSKAHDWRKGVSEFIIPAAQKAKVDFKLAMLSTDDYVSLEEMYKFYNEIDIYICASSSEGMSLSVLEAASCGRPVISTKVSGSTEIIKNGVTGFLVDRNIEEIVSAINNLKNKELLELMSSNIYDDIRRNWCWSKQTSNWVNFLYNA